MYVMYVCRKVKNSQARTGHQRGMGGRETDDDDTLFAMFVMAALAARARAARCAATLATGGQ